MANIVMKRGTSGAYKSLSTKDGNTLYFLLDTGEIYLGGTLMAVTDLSGKVDKVDGKGLSTNDFTNAFKTKLEGLANQNTFANIVAGGATISADSTSDTFTIVEGDNITITADASGDKITISSSYKNDNTTYTLTKVGNEIILKGSDGSEQKVADSNDNTTYSEATQAKAGLMSAADKAKLDGVAANANKYSLPTASATELGGVKVGAGLSISSGVLSADHQQWDDIQNKPTEFNPSTHGHNLGEVSDTTSYVRMTPAERSKLSGIATNANNYTHPSYTAKSSGLYKVEVDASGHVKSATAVTKSDITGLGIPAADTNTTYSAGDGLSLTGTQFSVKTGYTSSDKNYAVKTDDDGNLFVNVPWSDTNTTYSAGTGISVSSGKIHNAGVRSVGTGTANGTISVNTNGTAADVAVKGLGTAAFTAASNYATSAQGAKADTALQASDKQDVMDEIGTVDAKVNTLIGSDANTSARAIAASEVAKVVAGAPEDFNTLKEMSDWLSEHEDTAADMNTAIGTAQSAAEAAQSTADTAKANAATAQSTANTHIAKKDNPHGVNKAQVGLGNVENKSSATIRSEITSDNVTDALGYTPADVADAYAHPTHTAKSSGFYKVTVDSLGHVSGATAVTKSDITGLGVPAQDTTYGTATSDVAGLVKIGYTENGKNYPVELDEGKMFVNVPWTDNNTTYSAGSGIKLSGGAFSVNTGYTSSGKNYAVAIDSTTGGLYVSVPWTDTDTKYTHPSYTAKASGFYKVTVDGTGHVSGTTAVTKGDITDLGIPGQDTNTTYTLTKSGSTITLTGSDGSTTEVTDADTNTTYSAATTTAPGLMSAADKSKLDGIASGANAYSLPTAGKDALGGVKTTSTVTSTSGLTACPIISGVPYYKDTNTTYSLSTFGITATASELNILDGVTATASELNVLDGITATTTELNYVDGVTSNIQTQLDGKSPTGHTHSSYVNQNAFSKATVGTTTISAGAATDTITFAAGSNVTLTPDATNKKITIASTNTTYSNATTSTAGLMSKDDKAKLNGIESGANNYVHPNSGGVGGNLEFLNLWKVAYDQYGHVSTMTEVTKFDITALGIPAQDTTYSTMTAATSSANGKSGLVPAPAKGKQSSFLRGDGTWAVPTNTTYNAATTSAAGLMSASDKSKLDAITASADSVAFSAALTSGTKVGTITINGTATDLYCQTNTNTTYSAASGGGLSLSGTAFSVNTGYTTSGKNYAVKVDSTSGGLYVNVPWTDTDTKYSHPTYTSKSSGLYKITVDGTGHVSAATAVTKSDITALGIPGSDTNTTYSAGSGLSLSGTSFSVNTGYTTSGKNYAVAVDSTSGGLYVNVPWTDNNTVYTHPTYTAKSSGLYKITVDSTGHVSGVTSVTKSDITALGIPGSDTNTTYGIATASAAGLVKPISVITKPTINTASTTSGKYYPVQMSSDGNMFVNVPWYNTDTTYSFTNKAATLAWNTTSTIATVGGVDITVKMPANPDTNTNTAHSHSAGTGIKLSGSGGTSGTTTISVDSSVVALQSDLEWGSF